MTTWEIIEKTDNEIMHNLAVAFAEGIDKMIMANCDKELELFNATFDNEEDV